MDYDLSRLNTRSFEQLVQGIASKVLGAGLVVFGDGPDGGREASIEARLPYPTETDNWEGTTVLQAKFRQRPEGTSADGDWAVKKLRQELALYGELDSEREWPDYMIFATNVTLSPVNEKGAKDRLFALVEHSQLRGFDVWDYDKLRVYLDQFEDLRRSFAAYVLPGDVLAETVGALQAIKEERPDFDDAMARFLQKELLADQWVNLEQAGRSAEEQVPVSRVFVDLPISDRRRADPPEETSPEDFVPGFVAHVIEAASHRLDPRSLSTRGATRDSDERAPGPHEGRLVLLAGPGQGKSTVGQFVCQMFRAALLKSRPAHSLSAEAKDALAALEEHCESDELGIPTVRRFPLRVELSKFASDLADPGGARSLLEYLANLISKRIQSEVSPTLMSAWLAEYPWLLILDGLDEVPASSNRDELMATIQDFWVDASQDNADCLVIATTRPQGYSKEFSPRYYRHIWLTPLSAPRALRYAGRLLKARITTDDDRREDILDRLNGATARPDTARLMTTPLQVTIMATLLERMGQPPEGRWNLFSQYYRVIYDRELEREIPAASVLREYKPDIDAIHRRVGLLLQADSERAEQVEPRISRARFTELVRSRLREEEHEFGNGDDALVQQIIDAATDRLVFLVGVEADYVGFEIRSLQEFMAAEALLDGSEVVVETRLRKIAALPTWRNVFLFAAGRCFSDLQYLRDTVHTICAELNDADDDPLAALVLTGSVLAIDLLSDGVAQRQPRYERLLGREALRIVRRPASAVHSQLAEVYRPSLRRPYEEELKAALTVESFADTLGAWRTLAVLGSRSESWAFSLLESRLPQPGDISPLLHSLPPDAKSKWLTDTLAELVPASSPVELRAQASRLRSLGVLGQTPTWYRVFAELVEERRTASPEGTFRFENAAAKSFTVTLRSLDDSWGPLSLAVKQLAPDGDDTPASWAALFAAIDFARAPSAEHLADALEHFAAAGIEMSWAYSRHFSWPLGVLLRSASEPADLNGFAEGVRRGDFGDREDWVAAERRWRSRIKDSDVEQALPFDANVRYKGFPLIATTLAVRGPTRGASKVLLGWLRGTTHRPTRRSLVNLYLWLLGVAEDNARPPARDLAAAVQGGDFEGGLTWNVKGLDGLEWNDPLDDAEAQLLDRAGSEIVAVASDANTLPPELVSRWIRTWRERTDLAGLYRLIAICHPTGIPENDAKELLAADCSQPAARALLFLKAQKEPAGSDLAALTDTAWLPRATQVLSDLPDIGLAEAIAGKLADLVPQEQLNRRKEIVELGVELIARRPSGLLGDEAWRGLELFERPTSALPSKVTEQI